MVVRRNHKNRQLEFVLSSKEPLPPPAPDAGAAVTVTSRFQAIPPPTTAEAMIRGELGLSLSSADSRNPPEAVKAINKELHGGLEVAAVDADSPASKAGIPEGDILIGLHQWSVVNLDNVTWAARIVPT